MVPSRFLGSAFFFDMIPSFFRREVSRAEMDELRERHGGLPLYEVSSAEDPDSVGAAFLAALKEGMALKVARSSHPKGRVRV